MPPHLHYRRWRERQLADAVRALVLPFSSCDRLPLLLSSTMADDQSTIHGRRKPGRRRHGPLTVQNPGNSDEDESYERSMSHTARNHRPIPNSPYSEHSSLPSTSYTPKSSMPTNPVHVDQQLAYTEVNNPSNPSLSSPSGSSSPAVESTPPPSTPGQSLPPPSSAGDGSTLSGKSCYTATEDKGDARQHDSTPRMMAAEITKKAHLFGHSKSPSQTTVCASFF